MEREKSEEESTLVSVGICNMMIIVWLLAVSSATLVMITDSKWWWLSLGSSPLMCLCARIQLKLSKCFHPRFLLKENNLNGRILKTGCFLLVLSWVAALLYLVVFAGIAMYFDKNQLGDTAEPIISVIASTLIFPILQLPGTALAFWALRVKRVCNADFV